MFNVILKYSRNLEEFFANFPPIFKNINVGRDEIGHLMEDYTEKEGVLTQPRRMLKSNFFLENGTIIAPLLLFYLDLGAICEKNLSLCAIHSNGVLQQPCSVCTECSEKG